MRQLTAYLKLVVPHFQLRSLMICVLLLLEGNLREKKLWSICNAAVFSICTLMQDLLHLN